jgi:hypothetical protein
VETGEGEEGKERRRRIKGGRRGKKKMSLPMPQS